MFALQPRDPNAAEHVSSLRGNLQHIDREGRIQHVWGLHVRLSPIGTGICLNMWMSRVHLSEQKRIYLSPVLLEIKPYCHGLQLLSM